MATRTGDVPTGVAMPDPAAVTAAQTTITQRPPPGGAVLDGAYRLNFDMASQTVNGAAINGSTKKDSHWWAFRSSCTPNRCVATGAGLSDNNQQEPSGTATVLQFTDGHWQQTPKLLDPNPCDLTYSGPGKVPGGDVADTETRSYSIDPGSDCTLHGVVTDTVLTDRRLPGQGVQDDLRCNTHR